MTARFELYSVSAQDKPIVERLLALHLAKTLKSRKPLLTQYEADGFTVRFDHNDYEISKDGQSWRLPPRYCASCQKWKRLDVFMSVRGIEHPWCADCRFNNYAGAERARAELAYRVQHGQPYDDLLGIKHCKNPDCPNGGIIPPGKLRHGHVYCSTECREAVLIQKVRAEEVLLHPCENPACPEKKLVKLPARFCSLNCERIVTWHACQNPTCPTQRLVRPRNKFCSRACAVEYAIATGAYHAMSERGVQRIADQIAATGQQPNAAERARVISANNQAAPPRRKMVREDQVNGYLVRYTPDENGVYHAAVDGRPDITVSSKTKKEAQRLVAKAMREKAREEA